MKHLKTVALTRLFQEDLDRDVLWQAIEPDMKANLCSKERMIFQWKFDIEAGQKLLDFLKKIDPFNEDTKEMTVPMDMDGRHLYGLKVNVVETDGFRVELLVYEE
jgi:hypothetical protein